MQYIMNALLALVPLLTALLLLLLRRPAAQAATASLLAAAVAVIASGTLQLPVLFARAQYLLLVAEVLLIMLFGMILARMLHASGAMHALAHYVRTAGSGTGPSTALVVFGVVPFVECVTGYGIGVTVGVPILRALGYRTVPAALLGLMGLCAVPWGALAPGTAVAAELAGLDFRQLGVASAQLNVVTLATVAVLAIWFATRAGERLLPAAVPIAASAAVLAAGTYLANVFIGTPLAGVIGSAAVVVLSLPAYRLLGARAEVPTHFVRSLAPYAVLSVGLLVGSVLEMLNPALGFLALPPVWLAIACLLAAAILPQPLAARSAVRPAARSWVPVGVATAGFMLSGWLLSVSGLSAALGTAAGIWGVFPAPLLGAVGAILSGSNTGTNAMFAATSAELAAGGGASVLLVVAAANVAGSFASSATPARVLMALEIAQSHSEHAGSQGGQDTGTAAEVTDSPAASPSPADSPSADSALLPATLIGSTPALLLALGLLFA